MRPADIDRTDRRRLLASLAVTAVFYLLLFSALCAFGVLMPAGGSSPGRKGSTAISIRLAAEGGSGTARRAGPPAAASQNLPAKPELPADDASRSPASAEPAADSSNQPAADSSNQPAADSSNQPAAKPTIDGVPDRTAAGDPAGSETAGSDGGDAGNSVTVTAGHGEFIDGTTGGAPAFISWLDQAIRTKLSYPEKARNRNIEGTVTIQAEVSADGKNCMASIRQSSGSSILDRAAVSFVKSLFPSPVSPRKTFSGTLRIRYILTQEGT